ncbi:MAG: carboxypeptidase-like regulatory domain-containing protein, partial [Candidatus Nanohaloarchaea archaeon]|nr:carboxypeptidase-like regulatory domain-containing protein [Candidatus Nanohaloarchaea archaeon]
MTDEFPALQHSRAYAISIKASLLAMLTAGWLLYERRIERLYFSLTGRRNSGQVRAAALAVLVFVGIFVAAILASPATPTGRFVNATLDNLSGQPEPAKQPQVPDTTVSTLDLTVSGRSATVELSDGSGAPLAGQTVRLERNGSVVTRLETNSAGKASYSPLPRGTYNLTAVYPGNATLNTSASSDTVAVSLARTGSEDQKASGQETGAGEAGSGDAGGNGTTGNRSNTSSPSVNTVLHNVSDLNLTRTGRNLTVTLESGQGTPLASQLVRLLRN